LLEGNDTLFSEGEREIILIFHYAPNGVPHCICCYCICWILKPLDLVLFARRS
jgi:hypothetical protein